MPATAEELVALLDLETIEVNLFRGQQPDTQMQRVFGGQVAAQALVAAARTVDDRLAVHSLHSYFLRPGDTSVPIVYDVERVRDGRSFSTRRVLGRQHGRPIYLMTTSFQVTEGGFDHQVRMPPCPPPEDCPDVLDTLTSGGQERRDKWLREWAALELRHAGGASIEGRGGDPDDPRAVYWVRVAKRLADDPLVHHAALTYLSDLTLLGVTLVPVELYPTSPKVQAASLDHTLWFHRPFRADEWLLYDQASPSAVGGRGLAIGNLFSEDGRLVATVAQEGLIRPSRR